MTRRNRNTDPFDADEPTLPWQDPDSEVYDGADEPYEAPRYDAPSTDDAQDASDAEVDELVAMLQREKQRLLRERDGADEAVGGADAGAAPSCDADAGAEAASGCDADAEAVAAPGRNADADPAESSPGNAPTPEQARPRPRPRPAKPSTASSDTPAQPYRGRGCAWYLKALILFVLALPILRFAGCVADTLFGPKITYVSNEQTSRNPYDGADSDACRTLVEERFKDITTPGSPRYEEAAQRITSYMDKRVFDDFARTPEELGIDIRPIAELALGALAFDTSTSTAFPDADEPHASVIIRAHALCVYKMYFEFQDAARPYLRENGFSAYTNDGVPNDEQKAQFRAYFDKALAANTTETTSVTFRLTKENGSWVLDENEFNEGFRQLFMLPGPA